ncbi:heavy metal-associated isoprenylated plant protein 16-like [Malania oleifera]|uniref:heavy metal-associated isoprenylated plant protein 16-like n=1 Tax=Malania oleifera TaxID=397392 RepID=UPI0025AE23C5|nr:heavy metal-associated isoprenylated plant protein 16-like [Malania oleifera]
MTTKMEIMFQVRQRRKKMGKFRSLLRWMKMKMRRKKNRYDYNSQSMRALRTAVATPGVVSATLKGEEKNKIEVTGETIDVYKLAKKMKKKLGHAVLETVGPVDDKKKKEPELVLLHPQYPFSQPLCLCDDSPRPYYNYCTIM